MAGLANEFDFDAALATFLADTAQTSLELPRMSTGQRKHAKKVASLYEELTCVSYGFGQERQLHLFKQTKVDDSAVAEVENVAAKEQSSDQGLKDVTVKNTFIDDWCVDAAAEPVVFRSIPARLSSGGVESCLLGAHRDLDLTPIKESSYMDASPDLSTAASWSGSSLGSPRSLDQEMLSLPFGFKPPPGLEVRNTFIHFADVPADKRAVQSMPHGMFKQSLMEEVLSNLSQRAKPSAVVTQVPEDTHMSQCDVEQSAPPLLKRASASACALPHGTEVVIDGLSKCPAFNGMSGTVQSMDKETGRYEILFSFPVAGHKTAKVKADNLLFLLPSPAPCSAPALPLEQCASPVWAGCTPMAHPSLLRAR
jgi:hypothetical protein